MEQDKIIAIILLSFFLIGWVIWSIICRDWYGGLVHSALFTVILLAIFKTLLFIIS